MKLIITRHGETEENKAGILQGHLPGKLSALGITQAKKVAKRLKKEKIDFIFSSDLARASDTAKEIAMFHPNTPVEFTKELREINIGKFQGEKISELNKKNLNILGSKETETTKNLFKRAENFLNKIIKKHKSNTILFVGHDFINKALIAVITKKGHKDIKNVEDQHNTSINIFEIDENKNHKIHTFNCIKHLE